MAISIAVENHISPRHIVPIQLNIFIPVGTAIRRLMIEKNGKSTTPVVNMWWAAHAERQRCDGQRGKDHALVAKDGLARKHRDDFGRHTEER